MEILDTILQKIVNLIEKKFSHDSANILEVAPTFFSYKFQFKK